MSRTTDELEVLAKPKRTPSATVADEPKPKRAPRKKAVIEASSEITNRKAPTPLAQTRIKNKPHANKQESLLHF